MEAEKEERVKLEFDDVCIELNIDQETKDNAWESYMMIYNDYVLEGSQIEWLACSLYVSCRSTTTETVEGGEYSGNSISLTQILRTTKIRLIEFFRKVRKWLEMAKLPPIYLEKVETLERKFEVISVIFKKYRREFSTVFQLHDTETQDPVEGGGKVGGAGGGASSRPRSRKPTRSRPCTSSQLFHFGWILYIHIKNQFPLISDDLVNSHYLLLCCIDMLCAAAIIGKRQELLSPDFTPPSLPAVTPDCDSAHSLPMDDYPTIIPELCRQFSAMERECLVVRDYYWWPSVRRLFESQVLTGLSSRTAHQLRKMDILNCVIQSSSFQNNYRSLKQAYELEMLEEGEFDERVFLKGTETEDDELEELTEDNRERLHPVGVVYQSPQHLQYGTPLSGKEYLSTRENKLTPVSDANQSVIQLHLLLEDCQPEPTDIICNTCSSCNSSPLKSIVSRVTEMSQSFLSSFKSDFFESPDNFALVRLQLTQSLYFKLLTSIIVDEEKKIKQSTTAKHTSIQLMLEHDHFHKSLFALSAEMVLFSYSSHSRIFPWILSVIDIHCYHFYKVIEVVIKVEPSFPRAVVKHFSKIEELVLSSLAWKSSSPLYDNIISAGSVPRYEEVALPSNPVVMTTPTLSSPRQSRVKRDAGAVVSPLSSVRERYSSPNPASSRRQLFTARKNSCGSPLKSSISAALPKPHPPLAPKPPQGVVQVTQLKSASAQLDIAKLLSSATSDGAGVGGAVGGVGGGASGSLSAVLALTSLLKQTHQQSLATSPQKSHASNQGGVATSSPSSSHDPVSLQALVSMANMKSPLKTSPDKAVGGASSVPTITLTVSPSSQTKTPSKVATPTTATPTSVNNTPTQASQRGSPKRTGSLALFYRKVYQMAYLRMKDLCERLRMDNDIIQRVWTCFEHSLSSPDIMRDRNIDQMIMCSIYIVAKVLRKDITFQEIMRQYRHQPQAKSHVYRSVLLDNGPPKCKLSNTGGESEDVADIRKATPTSSAEGEGDSEGKTQQVEPRGDIIQFYNKVFIEELKDFVLKFSDESSELLLSPVPVIKRTTISPRKLSKGHQIFISPLKDNQSTLSPLAKTFVVSKSPASEFQELNHMVGSASRISCKRKLDSLLCGSPGLSSPAKRLNIEEVKASQYEMQQKTVEWYQGFRDASLSDDDHHETGGEEESTVSTLLSSQHD